jgi:hypothetical protein
VKPTWADNIQYDNRGHFREPHTGLTIGLGTAAVRDYLSRTIDKPEFGMTFKTEALTYGPAGRYVGVFFVEKEGFDALIEAVQIPQRYDLAFMSTKGISVTAARELAERLCSEYGIPLYILRDFDKAGFSGAGTFQHSNERYTYKNEFEVIDLGLRLDDVNDLCAEHGLNIDDLAEKHSDQGSEEARSANLELNGATEEEVEFLMTRRVELNAFTSDQLVRFIERKLQELGVRKVVPKKAELAEAFRLFKEGERIRKIVEAEQAKANGVAVPRDLVKRVNAYLEQHPAEPWDAAVRYLATVSS